MPTEAEMLPKDKYTMFDRKEKRYRKGIHSRFTLATTGKLDMLVHGKLIARCRAPQMDESVAESEPAWILSAHAII